MPAHSATAGSIIREEAYCLGKVLESSEWNGLLRDHITPSDIDLIFDNRGAILYADFSINCDQWEQIRQTLRGQYLAYEAAIKHGPHCAVICKHSVKPDLLRKIRTLSDVERFQVMVWDFGPIFSPVYDGTYWQHFVLHWVNRTDGPLYLRRYLLGLHAGLIKPLSPGEPPL